MIKSITTSLALIAALLLAAPTLAQSSRRCGEIWSLGGVKLGMSLEELGTVFDAGKGQFRKNANPDLRDGEAAYSWCGRSSNPSAPCADFGRYELIMAPAADAGTDDAALRVISVRLNVDRRETSLDALRTVLQRRWGQPSASGEFVAPESTGSLAISGVRDDWIDASCDTRATLAEVRTTSFWENKFAVELSVTIDRPSIQERYAGDAMRRAIELARP